MSRLKQVYQYLTKNYKRYMYVCVNFLNCVEIFYVKSVKFLLNFLSCIIFILCTLDIFFVHSAFFARYPTCLGDGDFEYIYI